MTLYSNIHHNYKIETFNYWLEAILPEILDVINENVIIERLEFILENNYFMFNEITYRQMLGKTIWIKVAPIYDNLVVGCYELKNYERNQKSMRMTS